ncbi:MAG: DUF2156 domain-containing protein [Desulfobulbaceae bacterium]|nr:DUF2156 domain-containing protein [Desulfobulbaceae bacterium]
MRLEFTPITLDRQDEYLERLQATPQAAADYSFVNLWAWAEEYGLTWAWDQGLVWIRQSVPGHALWGPVGPWDEVDWQWVMSWLEGQPLVRLPEELAMRMVRAHSKAMIKTSRSHWEYLYSVPELIGLSGNRFHAKMNLLRQFKGSYLWCYQPLTEDLIKLVLEMQDQWCTWRDCEASPDLAAEDRAIAKVLGSYASLRSLLGGVLVVDSRVVAFIVAEPLREDTLVIHFEKGMGEYKGVYQAINHEFLVKSRGFALVNREQDLGNEGLRKAKMSYNPVEFLRKYELLWR